MLRPRPARWFEILAARDDATLVLEALARTGAVELEARASAGLPAALSEVLPLLAQYLDLSARYHAYWPQPEVCRPSAFPEAPVATLQRSLAAIRAWAQDGEPLIQALQRGEAERGELLLWQRVLARARTARDRSRPAGRRRAVAARVRLFVLPPGTEPERALPTASGELETLASSLQIDGAAHLLVAGRPEALQAMAQAVTTLKGSAHEVPGWLQADAARNHAYLAERLAAIEREIAEASAALAVAAPAPRAALCARRREPPAVGDAQRARARSRRVAVLDHRLVERPARRDAGAGAAPMRRTGAAALRAAAGGREGAAAAEQSALGAAVRDLQPRARHAVVERGRPEPAAGDRRAADVRLHVRRRRPGAGDRRRGLVVPQALPDRAPADGRRACRPPRSGCSSAACSACTALLPALWLHPLDAPLAVLLAPLVGRRRCC